MSRRPQNARARIYRPLKMGELGGGCPDSLSNHSRGSALANRGYQTDPNRGFHRDGPNLPRAPIVLPRRRW